MKRAFTLIELLIVVAIIAILAAIAVPNFLEAQVRSKVSRAHSDMRSLATAVEAYAVDNNIYPILLSSQPRTYSAWSNHLWVANVSGMANLLTTPVAYISSYPSMVFKPRFDDDGTYTDGRDMSYLFVNFQGAAKDRECKDGTGIMFMNWTQKILVPTPVKFKGQSSSNSANWLMFSIGPLGILDLQEGTTNPSGSAHTNPKGMFWDEGHYKGIMNGGYEIYDPTNGTISYGMLWRLGGGSIAR